VLCIRAGYRVVSFASALEVEIDGLARSDLLYPNRRVLTIEEAEDVVFSAV